MKKAIFWNAILLFLVLVGAELAARSFLWEPVSRLDLGTPMGGFSEKTPGDWVPNQDGIWVERRVFPYNVVTNAEGFRSFNDGTAKTAKILALGDSFTWGLFVASQDIWTRIAEQSLRKVYGLDVQVLNNGMPGTTITDQLDYLNEKGDMIDVEVVLFAVFANDIANIYQEKTSVGKVREEARTLADDAKARFYGIRRFLGDHFALYSIARELKKTYQVKQAVSEIEKQPINPYQLPPVSGSDEQAEKTYVKRFVAAVSKARAMGGKVAVIYIPDSTALVSGEKRRIRTVLENMTRSLSLPYLDLTETLSKYDPAGLYFNPPVPGQDNYIGDSHFARYGHIVTGRAVADFLKERLAAVLDNNSGK